DHRPGSRGHAVARLRPKDAGNTPPRHPLPGAASVLVCTELTPDTCAGDPMKTPLFSLLILVCSLSIATAQTEWKVGLAEVKVTPEQPVLMSGYAGRTKPFEKVAADLYVKAMVLEDVKGQRAVLVTSDLLGFPAAVAEPIAERIQKQIGLKRE